MSDFQKLDSSRLSVMAQQLCARGFGMPALFFLEMYKPLAGVLAACGEGFHPLIAHLVGRQRTQEAIALLQDRARLEEFLNLIEVELRSDKDSEESHGG